MNSRILSIGGGKGGVGKSITTANLSVEIAKRGKKTIVVDMDLGASSLHPCLGVKSPKYGIKDFISRKKDMEEVLLDTGVNNLKLISGAGDVSGLSNIPYFQKMKLINGLKKLDADYILLDLGPGDSYNVIDYFLIADTPILVTTPEITSVMNGYSFLRSVVLRKLAMTFKNNREVISLIEFTKDPDNEKNIKSVKELLTRVDTIDIIAGKLFRRVLNEFKPKLIINMATNKDADRISNILKTLAEQYIGIQIEVLGCIEEDSCVKQSVSEMRPFIIGNPDCKASHCVYRIADNLLKPNS